MKTVLCVGCWDVLHPGHLAHLKAAKKFGERLVVGVTSDRWISKGPGRPAFSAGQRAEMLRALGIVDDVVIYDSPTAVPLIEQVRPDVYVKGPDYKDLDKDLTGGIYEEKAAVEAYGGKIVFTEEETFSSSTIINRFFQGWTEEQKAKIAHVKNIGGVEACEQAIGRLEKLNVLVVGEPIIDIYRFCRPEGISSKSPTISARFEYEEHYQGGSIAIANHLEDFCEVIADRNTGNAPTKIRYVSTDKSQRVFEVTHINEDAWDHDLIADCVLKNKPDVVVAADFGHGLFEGKVLKAMEEMTCFVGLNVQTNSSNYGFNLYPKHKRWDYLCLDTREIKLALHDRFSSTSELFNQVREMHPMGQIGMTLGSNGSLLAHGTEHYRCPSFTDNVVDAIGAGDAMFAITSVLLATECHPELVTFIGNVFAGLKTKIVGNKSSVSKAQLLKAIKGILA